MYFSYCPENGFEFHDTEDEARKRGEQNFEAFEDDACSYGWGENVGDVCWGQVRQRVVEVSRRTADPEQGDSTQFDEIVDYKLQDAQG